jgi:hypothetical protein
MRPGKEGRYHFVYLLFVRSVLVWSGLVWRGLVWRGHSCPRTHRLSCLLAGHSGVLGLTDLSARPTRLDKLSEHGLPRREFMLQAKHWSSDHPCFRPGEAHYPDASAPRRRRYRNNSVVKIQIARLYFSRDGQDAGTFTKSQHRR